MAKRRTLGGDDAPYVCDAAGRVLPHATGSRGAVQNAMAMPKCSRSRRSS